MFSSHLQEILFLYFVILFSAVFHEYAHAWMANYLGDSTAKDAGRLTLNPLRHIDLLGTVVIPLLLLTISSVFIGWAKPVPYNPYNLKDPRRGSILIGLAGPAANFILAVVFGLGLRFYHPAGISNFFSLVVMVNLFLGLFNLIPVPPLDGSKVFTWLFPSVLTEQRTMYYSLGIFVALIVALYLLPAVAVFFYRIIVGF